MSYLPDPANDETLTMTGYEWWRYRRIIEAEARLDGERLARAMHASYRRDPNVKRIEWVDLLEVEKRQWREHAAEVARRYGALSFSPPTADPEAEPTDEPSVA